MKDSDLVWGRASEQPSSVPHHYPLLAVGVILVAIGPSSWLVGTDRGYLLSAVALALVTTYAVIFTDVGFRTKPLFLVLFGGYWLGLVAHYLFHEPHIQLLAFILTTPLAVGTTVVILPQFVERRPQTFTMGLSLASSVLALVGVVVLWQSGPLPQESARFVGEEVMGLVGIRTVSVFSNPNPYGFVMMVGSLAALYTVLVRGGIIWVVTLGVNVFGLVMSEGDAALVGLFIGAVIVVSSRDKLLSVLGVGVGIIAVYGGIRLGHVPEVMQTTLLDRVDRWVRSLELLAADPLWGIGFAEVGEHIGIGQAFDHSQFVPPLSGDTGTSSGPHSSYVYPLLTTGVIAGSLYLGSLAYALGCGIRRRWTPWTAYVVGTAVAIGVYMCFESHVLGGVSVSAVVFGLFLGLMVLEVPGDDQSSL